MYSRSIDLLIVMAIIGITTHRSSCVPCYEYQTVPPLLASPKYFKLGREAGLQIFTNSLQVPCGGHLIAWKFVPPNSQVNGLHLAVFRPDRASIVNNIARNFTIIGETRLDGLSIANKQQWTTIRLPDSIAVEEGDSLGFFYDDYRTYGDQLGIGVASTDDLPDAPVSGFGPATTLVLISDASKVASGSIVDASRAPIEGRLAGLAAVFHPVATNSTRCLIPLTPPDVTCRPLRSRYTFYNGTCRLFHGCPRFNGAEKTANNFQMEGECARNCSRLLPESQRGAMESKESKYLDNAGQPPATIPASESSTAAPLPMRTLPAGVNPRCGKSITPDDWNKCSPPRKKRYHFNYHVGYCVSFIGCDPGTQMNTRNNWSSRDECNANCLYVQTRRVVARH